jgi:hypothetical protein
MEYPVKSGSDFTAARDWAKARSYVLDPSELAGMASEELKS